MPSIFYFLSSPLFSSMASGSYSAGLDLIEDGLEHGFVLHARDVGLELLLVRGVGEAAEHGGHGGVLNESDAQTLHCNVPKNLPR